MGHPFFAEINCDELLVKKMTPDYIPEIKEDIYDVSNFDSEVTQMEPMESLISEGERKEILEKVDDY
jgi:hypothetical protein